MKTSPWLLEILRDTIVWSVQRDARDLSARQLAVLLVCCLEEGPHTVRGLAGTLGVSKPAITRAADRLEELDLAKRREDTRDRRSVLLTVTVSGRAFVRELGAQMQTAMERDNSLSPKARGGAD